jgi:hypothetical protein
MSTCSQGTAGTERAPISQKVEIVGVPFIIDYCDAEALDGEEPTQISAQKAPTQGTGVTSISLINELLLGVYVI